MKCNKAKEWLSLEMDGRLAPQYVPPLQQHLSGCDACRAYRDDLQISRRLVQATGPTLSDSFDWKLQLRLNRALREAARDASAPWPQPAVGWRHWLLRAGFSATLGLSAVLVVALLSPAGLAPLTAGERAIAQPAPSPRLPVQVAAPTEPFFDTTRRPLDASFEITRQRGGLGLQQRAVTGGLSGSYWSGTNERDLLRIRQLEQDLEAMRRRLLVRDRQVKLLEAKLDSLAAPAVDRSHQE
jgi:hypothetical protein